MCMKKIAYYKSIEQPGSIRGISYQPEWLIGINVGVIYALGGGVDTSLPQHVNSANYVIEILFKDFSSGFFFQFDSIAESTLLKSYLYQMLGFH